MLWFWVVTFPEDNYNVVIWWIWWFMVLPMPLPAPYPSPIQVTEPDVFIIESLYVGDELLERFEGRALRDSLRVAAQRPIYYYVRTSEELRRAVELFRHSGYRYLHISCHGAPDSILTTLEKIPNEEVADIFEGKLKNRRIFFSSCQVGSGNLSLLLFEKNKGINSVAAPLDKIEFAIACAFWTAFYTKVLRDNPMKMEAKKLKQVLGHLCKFFGVRINWSHWTPASQKWSEMLIK